jgi:type I restriction enzyme S subunit
MKANAEKALNEAKALFQASLKEMLEPKEGWEEKTLGEMSEIQSGFAFKSTQFQKSGKYQVIRMGNVRPGLIRYNESPVYIESMDESKIEKALLKVGDMIITQTGSRNKRDYGYSVLIDKDNLLLNQRIARIRVVNTIRNKYLLYYSWTDYFRDQYFANEGGTVGQGNVGIDAIKYAVIPCPPLSEQQSIVETLDSLKSKVDQLQANFDKISQECDALKQAILRQVFE